MSPLFLILFVALLSTQSSAKKKPSDFFTLCKRSDPGFSKCVEHTLNEVAPKLIKGIPELHLQPLTPLHIPKISLNQGQGNFKLSIVLSDLEITGFKDMEFTSFFIDNDFTQMNFTSFAKRINLKGNYAMDGQILIIPVKGSGECTFDFENVTLHGYVTFDRNEKNGEKYLRCKSFDWDIHPGHASSYFTNLFNGDKTLGDNANKFFNENWKETYYTYKQLPEQAFGKFYKEYANRPLSLHPAKDWFLD